MCASNHADYEWLCDRVKNLAARWAVSFRGSFHLSPDDIVKYVTNQSRLPDSFKIAAHQAVCPQCEGVIRQALDLLRQEAGEI